jgi:nucleoside-diphosphate-sugar epimerase
VKRKILITGGGGFLGTALIKLLKQNADHEIYSVSRKNYLHLKNEGVSQIQHDLSSAGDLESILPKDIDVVFHTAALAGIWGKKEHFFNINTEGTLKLVDWAKKSGVKQFIYTSTPSVVFGKDDLINVDETTPYPDKHLCHYAASKALAEKYVLQNNSPEMITCAIRPHLIWGPGDPHLFPRIVEKAKQGKLKRVGEGLNQVDIVYVDNAAWAHVLAMEAGRNAGGKAYFIGQEKPVNLWDFIDTVLKIYSLPKIEESISIMTAYRLGFLFEKIFEFFGINQPDPPMTRFVALNLATSHYFNQENAFKDLGYKPLISIETGLKLIEQEVKIRKEKIKGF